MDWKKVIDAIIDLMDLFRITKKKFEDEDLKNDKE